MSSKYDWFDSLRFGMFIHWGLFSMGAIHCWQKNFERGTNEEWERYRKHFDPDLFEPDQWAKAAREAGMKYVVFTAKHHEGFCMFDSRFTDYKYQKKDLLEEIVRAFRSEGLKIGLYSSLMDWHHPDSWRCKNDPEARKRFLKYISLY